MTESQECSSKPLKYGACERRLYALHAFAIMPNHVHVVWTPKISMPRILQWLKETTAHRAKAILGVSPGPFWQDESWDDWIRSDSEMQKIIRYVALNPVKAGPACSIEE